MIKGVGEQFWRENQFVQGVLMCGTKWLQEGYGVWLQGGEDEQLEMNKVCLCCSMKEDIWCDYIWFHGGNMRRLIKGEYEVYRVLYVVEEKKRVVKWC